MDYRELCCENQVTVENSGGEGRGFYKGGLGDSSNPGYSWWMGVILWRRVEVVKDVDVFNARRSIVTLNGSMTLYITGVAINIGPHGWPRKSTG